MHGISITNGASDIRIGSSEIPRDVQIVEHKNGAGIFISGPDTHDVRVWGTHFGTGYFGEKEGNKIGIHLTNGTHSNIIGMNDQ